MQFFLLLFDVVVSLLLCVFFLSFSLNSDALETLDGNEWLDDNVIDFALQVMIDQTNRPIIFFPTQMGAALLSGGIEQLIDMHPNLDLSNLPNSEIFISPIHVGTHWIYTIRLIRTIVIETKY